MAKLQVNNLNIFDGEISETPVWEFIFSINLNYQSHDCFDHLVNKNNWKKYFLNYDYKLITNHNFRYVSSPVNPGGRYKAKLYPILKRISGARCFSFLLYKKLPPRGAHGLLALFENGSRFLPKGKIISFDRKEFLPFQGEDFFVPFIYKEESNNNSYYDFLTQKFDGFFDAGDFVLGIEEIE